MKRIIFIMSLVFLVSFSVFFSFAENYQQWPKQLTENSQKSWHIKFNEDISQEQDLENLIYIVNDNLNSKISFEISFKSESHNEVIITPNEDYDSDTSYSLIIEEDLLSQAGIPLKISVKMPFEYENTEEEYNYNTNNPFVSSYPSVVQAWNPIEDFSSLSEDEKLAKHDLYFDGTWGMDIGWDITEDQPYRGLALELKESRLDDAREKKEDILNLNPNFLVLAGLNYREGRYVYELEEDEAFWRAGYLPPESEFWLKNESGEYIPGWGEDSDCDGVLELDEIRNMLIDFTNPEFQDLVADKALALKETDVFDGIFLDWWNETEATTGNYINWGETVYTIQEETEARIALLEKIRDRVGEDFLILVNANAHKVPESAEYINGIFMECGKSDYDESYSRYDFIYIENTLKWAEENIEDPVINCVEGWAVNYDYSGDSRIEERQLEINLRLMRMFTAITLVHSDGYILFTDDNHLPTYDHLHSFYDFWEIDLGLPIEEKSKEHPNKPGVFYRKFENGIVIYNRSGNSEEVNFDFDIKRYTENKIDSTFVIDDLDADIFLFVD